MTLTPRDWRALAARHVPAEMIAAATGLSLECAEERLAEAEREADDRRVPTQAATRTGQAMTPLLLRPDLPAHRFRRLGM